METYGAVCFNQMMQSFALLMLNTQRKHVADQILLKLYRKLKKRSVSDQGDASHLNRGGQL